MRKMKKQIMEIGKRRVSIFSGDDVPSGAIVYTHMAADDMEQLVKEIDDVNAVLVAIEGVDWNRELSPWPGKRALKGEEDFGGGADIYLPVKAVLAKHLLLVQPQSVLRIKEKKYFW